MSGSTPYVPTGALFVRLACPKLPLGSACFSTVVVAFRCPTAATRKTAFALSERPLFGAQEGGPFSPPPSPSLPGTYKVSASSTACRENSVLLAEFWNTLFQALPFPCPLWTPTVRSIGLWLPAVSRMSHAVPGQIKYTVSPLLQLRPQPLPSSRAEPQTA